MSLFGDSRGAANGFFSSIGAGLGEASDKIFGEILPVWAAKELNVQKEDQLSDTLYNQNQAPPTMQNYPSTTESAGPKKTGFLFDSVNISGTALLGVAVAAVVGIAIAKL